MFFKKTVADPVCGMEIKMNDSNLRSHYQEREYYFCSADCLTKFYADPQKYVASSKKDCCGGNSEHNHEEDQHFRHCIRGKEHKHKCHGHHHHNSH